MTTNKVLKYPEDYAKLNSETNVIETWRKAVDADYQNVLFPDGTIAFRFDSRRGLVEIQKRGQRYYFDLARMVTARS